MSYSSYDVGGVTINLSDSYIRNHEEVLRPIREAAATRQKELDTVVASLVEYGAKAIHWDDGWHHREKGNEKITLVYPILNRAVKLGDRVVLLSHDYKRALWYTITDVEKGFFRDSAPTYKITPISEPRPTILTGYKAKFGWLETAHRLFMEFLDAK